MNSEPDFSTVATVAMNAALSLVYAREPMWRMMQLQELPDLAEREMFEVSARCLDWPKIAALALHIAQRQAEAAGK